VAAQRILDGTEDSIDDGSRFAHAESLVLQCRD
jgi:hypothetical protein